MFDDTDLTRTEDWAASFLVARQRILEIASKAYGPLFVTLKPCRARGHVSQPRFICAAGGGWKPIEEQPTESPVLDGTSKPKRATKRLQTDFDF
jgi:hypothetical protein